MHISCISYVIITCAGLAAAMAEWKISSTVVRFGETAYYMHQPPEVGMNTSAVN